MSETHYTKSGQKITTYYTPTEKRDADGALTEDTRKPGESRVEQNRRLREESRAAVSSRPDSRENLEKEAKRKKAAHEKIDSDVERVRSRQVIEELEESAAKRKKTSKKQQRREPISNQIGSRIPAALGGGTPPTWLRGGSGKMPAWMMGGSGQLPPWVMGVHTQAVKSTKKKPAAMGTGLPPWFRY